MNTRTFSHGCIFALLLASLMSSSCVSGPGSAQIQTFSGCETWQGGIVRGPKGQRRIAIVFTGHTYAEGAETILDELAKHHVHGSFFLTGTFLTNAQFAPLVRRMKTEGHYLGPHSDVHLLYCDWNAPYKAIVTRQQFEADLGANAAKLPEPFSHGSGAPRFFLPAFEHYNSEIANWSAGEGFTLVNYTPGTRSSADYTGEADRDFVSSQAIFDSILKREREGPHGLNGFILLLHLGSGPGRTDKFADRFGALLDNLSAKGYEFVRIDELLALQQK
jgi:peptidoglycan/xylan/chitin deacetylase (PgdA/CDA1 family)